MCEYAYFQAKALDDKMEVVGSKAQPPSGGLVGVVTFDSLQRARMVQSEWLSLWMKT